VGSTDAWPVVRGSLEFNYVPPLVIEESALAQKLSAQLLETSEFMIRDVLIAFRGLPAVARDERVSDTLDWRVVVSLTPAVLSSPTRPWQSSSLSAATALH
jgi:hypothetical protein